VNHDFKIRLRRQPRELQYVETGAIYAMRTIGFLQARHRFFGKVMLCPVPVERSLEIADGHDLELADYELRRQAAHIDTARFARVRALVMDFDGVFTDNHVLVFDDGGEAVLCNRADGLAFDLFRREGIPTLILSTEKHPVVAARAKKLKVPCLQGIGDKKTALQKYCRKEGIRLEDVLYVGNDLNDLRAMRIVGHRVCPADAHPEVRAICQTVLQSRGGEGVAREVAEKVMGLRYV
jgi:N-acylneuraminate cytidylyltransferase